MIDPEMAEEISRVWRTLTFEKRMLARRILERIPKERISQEDLKKPHIAEQVEKHGYFDIDFTLQPKTVKALEFLTELGYLEKRKETMYKVSYAFEAHPYVPYISPFGWVGISPKSVSTFSHKTFDTQEFKLFEETAGVFRRQIRDGMHKHITMFDYSVSHSYEAVIYEMKDAYFDAIMISDTIEGELVVHLAEPYVTSDGKTDRKTQKALQQVPQEVFLAGISEMDKYVEMLEWKKKSIGVIMVGDKAFFVTPRAGAVKEEEQTPDTFRTPDFFDSGLFSPENFRSRVFEDSTANYLQSEHDYKATARMKLQYLGGLEIDVFAERGSPNKRTITVCECKLRFDDAAIMLDEVEQFKRKIAKIKENESKRGEVKYYFWLVTNTEKSEYGVKELAKQHGIELKRARLSKDWMKRADFKIEEITSL
jgi:hypothetical protein